MRMAGLCAQNVAPSTSPLHGALCVSLRYYIALSRCIVVCMVLSLSGSVQVARNMGMGTEQYILVWSAEAIQNVHIENTFELFMPFLCCSKLCIWGAISIYLSANISYTGSFGHITNIRRTI